MYWYSYFKVKDLNTFSTTGKMYVKYQWNGPCQGCIITDFTLVLILLMHKYVNSILMLQLVKVVLIGS